MAPALERVLGLASGRGLRADTPLAGLGVDSLALLCIADVLAEDGWALDLARARAAATIGDLAACCSREEAA